MSADSWLYGLVDFWPILSSLTPLILLGGFYWLRTKFPSQTDFDKLRDNVSDLDTVVAKLKTETDHLIEERDAAPTRVQLLEAISALNGRVSNMEGGMDGLSRQLQTVSDYLQILVDRGLRP